MQSEGRRRRTPRLDISWLANASGHPRLGVVVPRLGATAVARNRVRRRLRESARRRILPRLQGVDVVVRARGAAYRATAAMLTDDLERWLDSLSD